ncbi:MAG: class I SAM-dependent methyltransferase [Thermoplasmata archaeon]|nr:class I SAM-dependent methyltransferase [Thermoplasmata archaeon]
MSFIREIHGKLIATIEKILSASDTLSERYNELFRKLTLDEFSIIETREIAKVLVIGCGSIPHTLTITAKYKGWSIVGIDKDEEAVKRARESIRRFGLEDKIIIQKGDGLTFDISGYNIIVVAHGVEPREKVLERIWKDADPGTNILYRTSWEILYPIYGKDRIPEWIPVKRVFYRSDLVKSLLIVKE